MPLVQRARSAYGVHLAKSVMSTCTLTPKEVNSAQTVREEALFLLGWENLLLTVTLVLAGTDPTIRLVTALSVQKVLHH